MAVEYETTPSTPGNPNPGAMFPLTGSSLKKRVMKHTNQESFRTGLFFCGKRKRPHRDRYHDYDHYRLHSSSVPRQREFFTQKNSYLEYKNRSRNAYAKPCERILPLNKNIVSKIEKISQDSLNSSGAIGFTPTIVTANDENKGPTGFNFDLAYLKNSQNTAIDNSHTLPQGSQTASSFQAKNFPIGSGSNATANKMPPKSGSFDSSFSIQDAPTGSIVHPPAVDIAAPVKINKENSRKCQSRHLNHKRKQSKRSQLKMQFHEQNGMDCGNLNDFLSSSSLSSSDSEAGETNESDREGDDELTDWPGNEAMVNFASKNDFKRAKPARGPINNAASSKSRFVNDDCMGQDEDTLMSADELPTPFASHLSRTSQNPTESNTLFNSDSIFPPKFPATIQNRLISDDSQALSSPSTSENHFTSNSNRMLCSAISSPIEIVQQGQPNVACGIHAVQIESEMSGETSNPFLSSLPVREIRAGCRRIHDERPGFTIFSSVNEHLARFVHCTNHNIT